MEGRSRDGIVCGRLEFMIIIIIYLNDNIIAPLILPLNFRSISADQDGGDKVGLSGHVADRLRISVV